MQWGRFVRLTGIAILLVTAGCAKEPAAPGSEVLAAQKGLAASPEAIHQAEILAKAARRAQGYAKPTGPDAFARYHQDIRERLDDPSIDYPANYRLAALRAAAVFTKTAGKGSSWAKRPLPWIERGPANVSGRTRGLIVDPSDPTGSTWFAGSAGGGIWKTGDAGLSWRNLTPDLPNLATVTLAQSQQHPHVLYAGTGEGFFNVDAVAGDGVFKSTDRGETWTQLASTAANPDFRHVNRLVVAPADPDLVVVATNTGLFRTTDGGILWEQVGPPGRMQQIIADPGDFRTLYATAYHLGVLKSTDAGASWALLFDWRANYLEAGSTGRMELAVAPSNTSKLYLAVDAPAHSHLWLSNDGGTTWRSIPEHEGTSPNWLGGQGWYDNAITVHPYNSRIVYVGGINLWRIEIDRQDQVRTTTELTNWYPGRPRPDGGVFPFVHADHHALLTVPFDEATERFRLLNGNDGGIEYSDDGGVTWTKTLNGYNTTQFYAADKRPGADEYIGGMQDNGTWRSPSGSDPRGETPWSEQIGGDGVAVAWHNEDPNRILASAQANLFFATEDGGATWAGATDGMDDVLAGGFFLSTFAEAAGDPDLIFTTGRSGVWRSDDFGATWRLASLTEPERWHSLTARAPVAVSLADPQVVWAGGAMSEDDRVFVSDDGGISFRPTSRFEGMAARVSGLATHPSDPSTAYAVFAAPNTSKILVTRDLGATWEPITGTFNGNATLSSNGFPNVATYSLLVMPFDPDVLWAGTEIGLFVSEDGGQTWLRGETGLPAVSLWQLSIVDDQVVAATHGRGVWSVALPELAGYTPPVAVRAPRLREASLAPTGTLHAAVTLRAAYDSFVVALDGEPTGLFHAAPGDTLLALPITATASYEVAVQVLAYLQGRRYASMPVTVPVFPLQATHSRYITAFDAPSADFLGEAFSVFKEVGFESPALHSPHRYPDRRTLTHQLRVPIRVAETDAVLRYRDIAIIEPGEEGTVFGDAAFWDYVVVEGSLDGITWRPLADGYDARFDAAWLDAFERELVATDTLYRWHEIDLHDTFAPGEVIFVRFRLYADQNTRGWGWAIDDLAIQPDAPVATETAEPPTFSLEPGFPNPFREQTTLRYTNRRPGRVQVAVYDLQGRRIRTLLDAEQGAGSHEIVWDGLDDASRTTASGVYLCRLRTDQGTATRTVVRIR